MRISDWSSDVCSSDLSRLRADRRRNRRDAGHVFGRRLRPCGFLRRRGRARPGADRRQGRGGRRDFGADRKRVVSGKSVSVRVDLGGRRIIKKKKKNNTQLLYLTQLTTHATDTH